MTSGKESGVVINSKFHYFVVVSGFVAVSGMAAYELWKIFVLNVM
jgi:hypothetical protein